MRLSPLRRAGFSLAFVLLTAAGCTASAGRSGRPAGPAIERSSLAVNRALSWLSREAPRWPRENHCFSCHHSGDAVRVLFTARRLAHDVPDLALADTVAWLSHPEQWDHQKGDPAFNDRILARLQFSAALASAREAGALVDRRAVEAAAGSLARLEAEDGAWAIEPRDVLGSPATWGTHLATAMACLTLEALDEGRWHDAVERGRAWLRQAPLRNVLEAAAVLLSLGNGEGTADQRRIEECLGLIRRSRGPRGAWGPYATSPPEPFDTALVLIALRRLPSTPEAARWMEEARAFLVESQEESGAWPATTRPRGAESYAQTTSTTAWATLALLLTG